MYITRKIEQKVLDLSASFPVVMVTGARQVGKTTLLRHLADTTRGFVSLDIPEKRIMAKEEPTAFLAMHPPPVIIDEFQYAPTLLPYIKAYVDEHKRNGDFWLTGSQGFLSMKNVSESMAGRVGIISLFSLSNSEINRTLFDQFTTDFDKLISRKNTAVPINKSGTYSKMLKGGMPRVYHDFPATLQDYFGAYFQTYLSRDIKDLSQVADELAFYKFLQVCSSLIAENVEFTNIAKKVGISMNKAKEWVSILVSSGIIILLQPYFNNLLKRVVKSSRMYFMDTGLLCYLRGIDNADTLESLSDNGEIFENYVVSEVYKSFANMGLRPPLYYYRDANNRKEIDLIIEQNGVLHPIEIKEGSNPDKKAIKNFNALASVEVDGIKVGTGSVICNATDIYPIASNVWAVPHWYI